MCIRDRVKADNLGDAKIQIKAQIEAVYKRHRYLLEGDTLTADEIACLLYTSTAVGLFNSVINVILLIIVNAVVKKLNDGEGI